MRFFSMVFAMVLLLTFSGCGKLKEASQLVKSVKNVADTVQAVAEGVDEEDIDLDELDISEKDMRQFYTDIKKLHNAYPDINFEVALTAALEASTQGKNLERIIEKETDMSFQEYSTLSMALTMIQVEAMGVTLTEQMLSAAEEGLAQFDDIDTTGYTEEQLAELETQRKAMEESLIEAKEEMQAEEFMAQKERVDMIIRVREELMD